ncbi:MAG: hypothetical protein HY813_00895 [Candidatus Portnoybacteria bacterium]|nr:hypothetical protein [Candidatus Portnoybacteria bacterium]
MKEQIISGTIPENLPAEKHIKEAKKEIKQLERKELKSIDESKSPTT